MDYSIITLGRQELSDNTEEGNPIACKQHGLLQSSSSLSLPLNLVLSVSGHKSDEALIQNLCHKTPEPVLCADCLHGDPSGKAADARRVALITVRCAECDAEQIRGGGIGVRGTAIYELTTQVTPYLNRCLDLFKKQPQLPLPNTILVGTNAVNQGIAISLGILENIPDKLIHS
ncbi:hypothetical protein Peur_060944 [Populus x canadensis]